MTGYRDPGKARSPALEKLAATRSEAVPTQVTMLSEAEVTRRLELATGVHGDRPGCLMPLAFLFGLGAFLCLVVNGTLSKHGDASTGVWVAMGILFAATSASFLGGKRAALASEERRKTGIATALAWATQQPFEVTGYRDWLVNDRSLFVLHLSKSIEKATFLDAVKAIDPAIEAEPIDDTSFSVVIPSCVITGESPTRFGNIELLKTLWDKLVLPLHSDVGVARVAMGGTVHERTQAS